MREQWIRGEERETRNPRRRRVPKTTNTSSQKGSLEGMAVQRAAAMGRSRRKRGMVVKREARE